MLLQYFINSVAGGSIYLLVALGFALIYNTTKVFHIAHGAVFTIGAFTAFVLSTSFDAPLYISLLVTVVVSAGAGAAAEHFCYYPLFRSRASATVVLLTSLALYGVLVNALAILFGNEARIILGGASHTYSLGPANITEIQVMHILVASVVCLLLFAALRHTRSGRVLRAVSDNPRLATALGVNTRMVRTFAFLAGSALAGLAGALAAFDTGINPQIGFGAFLAGSVACIVGGVGSFAGTVIGALLLATLQSLVTWHAGARWESAATLGLLVAFLIFRPTGLLSARKRAEEI